MFPIGRFCKRYSDYLRACKIEMRLSSSLGSEPAARLFHSVDVSLLRRTVLIHAVQFENDDPAVEYPQVVDHLRCAWIYGVINFDLQLGNIESQLDNDASNNGFSSVITSPVSAAQHLSRVLDSMPSLAVLNHIAF